MDYSDNISFKADAQIVSELQKCECYPRGRR